MNRSGLRAALVAGKVVVSVGLLAVLFSRADLHSLLSQFRSMDPRWMVAALAVYAAVLWVSAWRWQLLLQVQTVEVGLGVLTRSFLVATFFNNFLPSNIGGDVVRIADTAQQAGSKTVATAVVLLDRVIGLTALLALAAGASLIAARLGVPLEGLGYLWLAFGASVVVLVACLASPARLSRVLRRLAADRAGRLQIRLGNLSTAVERFGLEPRVLIVAFGGALVVQLLLVAFYVLTARGLAVPFPLLAALVVVPVSLAAQLVPVSVNGFGVREAVFAFFFTNLGLDVSSALSLSLGSAGLIMLFSLSGGAVFLFRGRQSATSGSPSAELT